MNWQQRLLLALAGWVICSFGQPAWSLFLSTLAAGGGYALIWLATAALPSHYHRFLIYSGWFSAVQLVQLFWFLSHPYLYIYAVYLFFALALGIEFGVFSLFITPDFLAKRWHTTAMAGLWVLMEWTRHFFLAGFSWNPVGLAMTASPYSLQLASLGGLFGLSFWTIFSSLLLFKLFTTPSTRHGLLWTIAVCLPYGLGALLLFLHSPAPEVKEEKWQILALQPAFPVEEAMEISTVEGFIDVVTEEWQSLLMLCAPHRGKNLDFVLLPECVVPFSCYSILYPYEKALRLFTDAFGSEAISLLPSPELPFGDSTALRHEEPILRVNNAFFAQGIANCMNCSLLIGLEGAERQGDGSICHYNALFRFSPQNEWSAIHWPPADLYAKQVLLPLAEYIPSEWCRSLAATYGITSSFTPGACAISLKCTKGTISPSICYEETFGNLMREGKRLGADLFANITNDGWYPGTLLPRQHRDHALPRAVENGVPLVRASNTGFTTAIDSCGRTIASLEGERGALYLEVPRHTYSTLYTRSGDLPLIAFSSGSICWIGLIALIRRIYRNR